MAILSRIGHRALAITAVVAAVGVVPVAHAGLVGVSFNAGTLYDINTTTGAATNARSTGLTAVDGVAFRPSDSALFALTQLGSTPTQNALYRINATTGAATLVGATGLTGIIEGDLAFDPTSGLLYGIQDTVSQARALFSINTTTGVATVLGDANGGNGDLSTLAFDAAGNLYTIDTSGSFLLVLNKSTGATISSVATNVVLGTTAGMAFDPATGTAYVADGLSSTSLLYTLNTSTGALTSVGSTGQDAGFSGLSFSFTPRVVTGVPEPSAMALLGLGLVGLGMTARRRRSGRTSPSA